VCTVDTAGRAFRLFVAPSTGEETQKIVDSIAPVFEIEYTARERKGFCSVKWIYLNTVHNLPI
jgi:hypothetical protein